MAIDLYFHSTGIQQRHIEHLLARGSVVADIDGTYYVSCSKHPEARIEGVKVSMQEDTITQLTRAFDSCSGCLDDEWNKKKISNTRFPEGAEL